MCNCRKFTYCMGNIIYICERIVSCCAATSVVTCIVATLLIMLALGIGLGYNYCYVDFETGRNKNDNLFTTTLKPKNTTTLKPKDATTSKSDMFSIQPLTKKRKGRALPIKIAPTMTMPLSAGIDFSVLIQKLKERKQNCTLHLIV